MKNKWKCVLKDGMIHVNGKDYLFAKCTGYAHTSSLFFVPLSPTHAHTANLSGNGIHGPPNFILAFLALSFSL